jgi:oxygen-independent coproporphyrinogen-3 oxidase
LAGIYIHIPFCKQACTYCNFHFSTSLTHKRELVFAIEKEISNRSSDQAINTIYFGGGTPGILEVSELASILAAIQNNFKVAADAEITLETNPDDINPSTLEAWLKMGINRLSIGIQSFDDAELKWMNRAHNAAKSVECLHQIKDAGFTNYSADLIYGSPMQSMEILQKNIDQLLHFDVPHISSYALTVEEKTVLHKRILQGKELDVDANLQAKMFYHIIEEFQQNDIEQYEISNFAKLGQRSKHNSSYWQGETYIGIGPSAHSFDGVSKRSWNIADNKKYVDGIDNNFNIVQFEILSSNQQQNEAIMLGLRTKEGIDILKFTDRFGAHKKSALLSKANMHLNKNLMVIEDDFLKLTDNGKFLADGIAADLFEV